MSSRDDTTMLISEATLFARTKLGLAATIAALGWLQPLSPTR
jgi:hypothetical protein